jgi:hypothetical protein
MLRLWQDFRLAFWSGFYAAQRRSIQRRIASLQSTKPSTYTPNRDEQILADWVAQTDLTVVMDGKRVGFLRHGVGRC